MPTKAQQEQSEKLRRLHEEWRDPKKTHPDRVETLRKEWERDGRVKSIDLDYIGHANLRDALCYADPLWTWRHAGFDATGHRVPLVDRDSKGAARGLWIELEVHGLTKPGYGTVEAGTAAVNAMKELIGDALRNAAQSFGIAVALWAKIELAELEVHQDVVTAEADAAPDQPPAAPDRQGQPDAATDPATALASAPTTTPEQPQPAPTTGQCPHCNAPAGKGHGTSCPLRQANGEAPPADPPAPDEEAAPDTLTLEQVKVDLAKLVTAMRGDQVEKFVAYRKVHHLPDDLNQADEEKLRGLHRWLSAQPVARVAGTSSG